MTARARGAAATGCPPPPTNVAGLLAVQRHSDGTLNRFRPVACYGHRTLAFRGYVVATQGLGCTNDVSIEPTWLDGWHFSGCAPRPTSPRDVGDHRYGTGPDLLVASSSGWAPTRSPATPTAG